MKVLLVGEANPHSTNPDYSLYPWPVGSAGWHMAVYLRVTREEYLKKFDRVNLFHAPPERWSAPEARRAANFVLVKHADANVIVMLGARVAAAFGYKDLPVWKTTKAGRVATGKLVKFIRVPHPSGRCRDWNDPRAAAKLRRLLRVHGEGG